MFLMPYLCTVNFFEALLMCGNVLDALLMYGNTHHH
jgi:hypothetical protein